MGRGCDIVLKQSTEKLKGQVLAEIFVPIPRKARAIVLKDFLSNVFYLLAGCSESWSQESPFTSDRSKCGNDLASPSYNTIH